MMAFLCTPGISKPQPIPYNPLPLPVLYPIETAGCNPFLPGGTAIGIEKFPVPVNRFVENFSPIPVIAPPPVGREIMLLAVPDFGAMV